MASQLARRGLAVAIVVCATLPVASQVPALRVVSAAPSGELTELADVNQVRIVFSEAMVPVGAVPSGDKPAWVTMAPALPGHFYWSGTRTLMFSPDAETAVPYATRVRVRIDASATSVAGRALGAPFELTFTTPTVRLRSAEWYRKDGRFDRPAIVVLRFNQPVTPADVLAHARISLTPHGWNPPFMSPAARAHLSATDPGGLARFDAKVAAIGRVMNERRDRIAAVLAASWDEERYPPAPEQVVLELPDAPLDAWLTIALDASLPSPAGPETHAAHSTVVRLERSLVIEHPCRVECVPSFHNPIFSSQPLVLSSAMSALTITDVTDPGNPRPVTAVRSLPEGQAESSTSNLQLADLGFDPQPPATTYRFEMSSTLTSTDGQTLGHPWVEFVENIHEPPAIALGGAVWEAAGGPAVPIATRNLTSITQRVAPIAPATLVSAMTALRRSPAYGLLSVGTATVRTLTTLPDRFQAQGVDAREALGPSGKGLIWLAASPGFHLPRSASSGRADLTRGGLVQVTNLGLTVKDSPDSTLVFVTALDSGAPVAQAQVSILGAQNQTFWRGTTNADGVALAPALALRAWDRRGDWSFVVTASKADDFAYVGSDWSGDVQPHSWGLRYDWPASPNVLRGSIFTDRGTYKAGDDVRIKAVLRDDPPSGVRALSPGAAFDVVVRDSRNAEVDRRTVRVGRWSSVDWSWTVPAEPALGRYSVQVTRSGLTDDSPGVYQQRAQGSFLVAAYRRPDFRVDATLEADAPVMGSTLRGVVDAKYLFGSPLRSRPVRWFAHRTPVASIPEAVGRRYREAQYAFGYVPDGDQRPHEPYRILEKTETLGADGRVQADVPTAAEHDFAFAYLFEGDVEDVSGQHIANRAGLVVHPAALYVGLTRPKMFVDISIGTTVGVVAVDLAGQPLSNVPVTLQLFREEWARQPVSNRGVLWGSPWQRKEIAAGEWNVRSAAADTPVALTIRDGGSYVLRATARDAAGRRTRTDVRFYAIGPGKSFWRSEGNRIDLTPERRVWKPGETARILVQSPWERATALLTTEREGIRTHRRFEIRSTQDTVDVPITEADVPNLYVSVVLVKGRMEADQNDLEDLARPGFRVGYTELTVDDASKRLRVEVSSDKTEYRPHAPARVSVAVKNSSGAPVRGEVTLWAMDYGLLSLTNYTTPDVVKAIYAHKPLQVMTADNRSRLIGRRPLANDLTDLTSRRSNLNALESVTISIDGVAQGQGGVGLRSSDGFFAVVSPAMDAVEESTLSTRPAVRTDFRPLVFWLGSIATDANGRATTDVTLPDSLTTYRIMAVAGDDASHFGFGEREIQVTKPLAMLPAFPRFMSRGDTATFGAVVTNTGKTGGQAVVTIRSLDPAALAFDGAVTRTFALAPGASEPVRFDATARGLGSARVRVTVTLGAETDAFETALPVTVPTSLETTAAYGETTSSASERIVLPPGLVPRAGGLTVDLASTALVGLGESARYVNEYPYECAEQKASRALALLLAADLGGAFSMNLTPDEHRRAATSALTELSAYQCSDYGGFTLWPGQCQAASPYLTAYVLHVMKVARDLKVAVDQYSVDRALDYLTEHLRTPAPEVQWYPVWGASQAFAVKVLAEFGRNPRADITRLAGVTERLPVFAMSYLADAMAATGERGPRYQALVARLSNAVRVDADRAHVEEIDEAALAWLWNSNARATAVVLAGLSQRKDSDTLVAPLVRGLLAARTNGRWGTTHENAAALEALVSYYRTFENEVPQMTATVTLGGSPLGRARFAGRTTTAQEVRVAMPDLVAKVAAAAAPTLTIARTGTGRLFYTARVQYLAPVPPEAADRGFHVERRYERYVEDAKAAGPALTTFDKGDLIRVTVRVTLRGEGRYLALTDPIPAGFETIDSWFNTTASDLGRVATQTLPGGTDWLSWWRRGGFDHVEKRDDRVEAFATRLSSGRHDFSYLVRATTAGTFTAGGTRVEAMYAPELSGRGAATTVIVR